MELCVIAEMELRFLDSTFVHFGLGSLPCVFTTDCSTDDFRALFPSLAIQTTSPAGRAGRGRRFESQMKFCWHSRPLPVYPAGEGVWLATCEANEHFSGRAIDAEDTRRSAETARDVRRIGILCDL